MKDILRMIEEGRYHMIDSEEMVVVESTNPVPLHPNRGNDLKAA